MKEVIVPENLLKALRQNKSAFNKFESLPPSHKKEYIKWIEEAKKEETRLKRIKKMMEMLIESKD